MLPISILKKSVAIGFLSIPVRKSRAIKGMPGLT
jgi:hypothetical protein